MDQQSQSSNQQSQTPRQNYPQTVPPLVATRIQIVPQVILPPVPTSNKSAENIQTINSVLSNAGTVVQVQQSAIQSAIQTKLGMIGATAANCRMAVEQYIQSRLTAAQQACGSDQQCIETYIAGVTSAAWESAVQAGCQPMPSDEGIQPVGPSEPYFTPPHIGPGPSPNIHCGPGEDCALPVFWPPTPIGYSPVASGGPDISLPPSGGPARIPTIPGDTCPPGMDCAPPPQLCYRGGIAEPCNPPPPPPPPPPPFRAPQGAGDCRPQSWSLTDAATIVRNAQFIPRGPAVPTVPCAPITIANYSDPAIGVYAIAVMSADGTVYLCPVVNGSLDITHSYATMNCGCDPSGCFPHCNPPPPPPPPPPTPPSGGGGNDTCPICPPPPQPNQCSTDNTPTGFDTRNPNSNIPSAFAPEFFFPCDTGPGQPPCPTLPPPGGGGGPPQQPCATCGKPQPCGCQKQCPPDSPKSKQWCVYQDANGNCYVVSPGQSPNSPTDTLQGCANDPGGVAPLYKKCQSQSKGLNGPLGGFPISPVGSIFCRMDADVIMTGFQYVPNLADATAIGIVNNLLANTLTADTLADRVKAAAPTGLGYIMWIVTYIWAIGVNIAGGIIVVSVGTSLCASFTSMALKGWLAILSFLERWVGPVFGKLAISSNYEDNWICPQQIPTTSQANACFLADTITASLWDTWVRANNDCPEPQLAVVEASRNKEGVGDLVQLFMRGLIDADTYNERIRELGYIYDYEANDYLNLAQQIPPVSELIRMMVRDVADDTLVTDFGMDDEFSDKWIGQLQQWGHNQGITDQYARYEWRAHWSIPSPTQLYEMFHRFRNLPAGDPLAIDQDTVRTALKQQDILPYWVDKLIGISFRTIPRSDILQMQHYGVFDQDQIRQNVSKLGYSDDDTDIYVKYINRQHALQARTHPYTRLYIRGEINEQQLRSQLERDYYQANEIDGIVQYAQGMFTGRENAQCRDGLKRQYFLGQLDDLTLRAQLTALQYDPFEVDKYINTWRCVRASRVKHVSALKLCGMAKQGVIGLADMALSLSRIGYDEEAVTRMVASCQKQINDALQKAQERLQKQQQKAAQAAARKAAQLAAKLARQAAQAARQAQTLQKAAQSAQKALIKAAEKWSKGCGGSAAENMHQIIDAVDWIENNTTLQGTEILEAVTEAATLMDGKSSCDWSTVYQDVAIAWSEAQQLAPGPAD